MQKQKENIFSEKFRLLNSQEHAEEINWTSSGSSEFENKSNNDHLLNISNRSLSRKRKRKKKVPKNISNLNVTIVDTSKEVKDASNDIKSPFTRRKSDCIVLQVSPVFAASSSCLPSYKCKELEPCSPILTCKVLQQPTNKNIPEKSPILPLKNSSPKVSPKVRKKLFKTDKQEPKSSERVFRGAIENSNITEELHILEKRKNDRNILNSEVKKISTSDKLIRESSLDGIHVSLTNLLYKAEVNKEQEDAGKDLKLGKIKQENKEVIVPKEKLENSKTEPASDNSFTLLKTSNTDLVKRVKTYFDSHFSSENASQHSIDSLTPRHNSKTSDEVDIVSSITQVNSIRVSSQSEQGVTSKDPSPLSSQSAELNEKFKKVRHKKGGLAYRLNALLKKQSANISLWQHERFLAGNSNFVIPKGEHMTLRIRKINFKFSGYLLDAVDANNMNFLILINAIFVQNTIISQDTVIKLYEPFKIVDFQQDCKLIINVCKFETVTF